MLWATRLAGVLKVVSQTKKALRPFLTNHCGYVSVVFNFRKPCSEDGCGELLNGEIFYSLREARIIIGSWRRHYNAVRPHASLKYKPPAPEVFMPAFAAWPASPATLAILKALN